jgi:hypothetical protein
MLEKVREKISARAEVQDHKNKFRVKRTSGAGEIRALSVLVQRRGRSRMM